LLEENPKYIERVLFLQIAVPSRTDVKEYQDLKEEIDKLVGMINGKFSTSKWSPVRYIYGQINQVYCIRLLAYIISQFIFERFSLFTSTSLIVMFLIKTDI